MAAGVVNVNDVLDGHVQLDLECLDRVYLNAYVPKLQSSGQVVVFMRDHLGMPIPSPAVMERIGNRFRDAVKRFVALQGIPTVKFGKGDRHIDVMRPFLENAAAAGREGVVALGTAQEFQSVWTAYRRKTGNGAPLFAFVKADRRVSVFYFYIWDRDFGPGFIKLASYFPYPGKVWLNGHEWAKRQAARAGLGFTALANGFASCEQPDRLQAICDRLGPAHIQRFFERWMRVVPTPLDTTDRQAGYWWELSMRQVEVSRTLVFDRPRRARAFFEALVADNIDIGRPDEIKVIFDRRVRKDTGGEFATKVVTRGTDVTVNAFYKHSRIKEYLKEGRALRIETVINSPTDLGVHRRLEHLPELVARARGANRRLLECQRAGQGCAIETALWERCSQPSLEEGHRTGALRFGDQRAMALAGALCVSLLSVVGFTNKTLRGLVSSLLDRPYGQAQMTYDLRRLRLKGLIRRLPRSNTYVLTPDGQRFALAYTKLGTRVLPPLLAAHRQPAPPGLRLALRVIDWHVNDYPNRARLRTAA